MIDTLAVYLSVFLTVACFSLLYKENFWFRIAESLFLGTALGYGVAFDLKFIRDQLGGKWSSSGFMMIAFALALVVGLLWYFRFSKKYFFLYRWPLAILVGTGIGMVLKTIIFTQFLDQIMAQVSLPWIVPGNPMASLNNILLALMVPIILIYFWFTGRPSGKRGYFSYLDKIARYVMMAGFGASFGYAVLSRYTRFIGRVQFLWGIPPNPIANRTLFMIFTVIIMGSLFGWDFYKRKSHETVKVTSK